MSDPIDIAMGAAGGAGLGSLLMGLLKSSAQRNVTALDSTLASLAGAVKDLREEVQHMRETHIGLAKDLGGLQKTVNDQEREMERLRRHIHRWGAFLQKLTLRTATGEHVKIELPEAEDDE